jgi:hypothetical protein
MCCQRKIIYTESKPLGRLCKISVTHSSELALFQKWKRRPKGLRSVFFNPLWVLATVCQSSESRNCHWQRGGQSLRGREKQKLVLNIYSTHSLHSPFFFRHLTIFASFAFLYSLFVVWSFTFTFIASLEQCKSYLYCMCIVHCAYASQLGPK